MALGGRVNRKQPRYLKGLPHAGMGVGMNGAPPWKTYGAGALATPGFEEAGFAGERLPNTSEPRVSPRFPRRLCYRSATAITTRRIRSRCRALLHTTINFLSRSDRAYGSQHSFHVMDWVSPPDMELSPNFGDGGAGQAATILG